MPTKRLEALRRLLSVNDHLIDDTIRHAIALERLKKHEAAEIVRFLERRVFPDILRRVDGGIGALATTGLKAAKTKRVADTLKSINATIAAGARSAKSELEKSLSALAMTEAQWQAASLAKNVPIDGVSFDIPSIQTLRAIIRDEPVSGRTMTDWMLGLSQQTQKAVQQELVIGLTQGETVQRLMQRLRGTKANKYKDGIFATTRRQAQAIVRTSANHVSSRARELTFEENQDVIKEVQIVATLDSRTSDVCMGYDGQTFPVGKGPRPPFHVNCRTTVVPVTKSWKELGAKKKTKVLKESRASMNGQVSGKVTYGQWLKRQPVKVQNEALGIGRAKLFRAGRIGVEDLTGKFGKSITLEQLERLEGIKPPLPTVAAPAPDASVRDEIRIKLNDAYYALEDLDKMVADGVLEESVMDMLMDDIATAIDGAKKLGFTMPDDVPVMGYADWLRAQRKLVEAEISIGYVVNDMDVVEYLITRRLGVDKGQLKKHLKMWATKEQAGAVSGSLEESYRRRARALGYPTKYKTAPVLGEIDAQVDEAYAAMKKVTEEGAPQVGVMTITAEQRAKVKYHLKEAHEAIGDGLIPEAEVHLDAAAIAGLPLEEGLNVPWFQAAMDDAAAWLEIGDVDDPMVIDALIMRQVGIDKLELRSALDKWRKHLSTDELFWDAADHTKATNLMLEARKAGWASSMAPSASASLDDLVNNVAGSWEQFKVAEEVVDVIDDVQAHALMKYVTAKSPSSRTNWKKKAIEAGWDANKKLPQTMEELDALLAKPPVTPPAAPPVPPPAPPAPPMPADQQYALQKYIDAKSASSRTHWKKKAIDAGWDKDVKLPQTQEELDLLLAPDMPVPDPPAAPPPPPTPPTMPADQQHALKKYVTAKSPSSKTYWKKKINDSGYKGPLPKNETDLEYIIANPEVRDMGGAGVSVPEIPEPEIPTIKIVPNQYDDLLDDVQREVTSVDSFSEYSKRELDAIMDIRSAKTTKEVERRLQAFFPERREGGRLWTEVSFGRMDPGAARDYAEWVIKMAHGVHRPGEFNPFNLVIHGSTKWGQKGAAAMPGRAMAWSSANGVQANSKFFGKGKWDSYQTSTKHSYDVSRGMGEVPFHSTGHKSGTWIHEFGHQFGEVHARFDSNTSIRNGWATRAQILDEIDPSKPAGRNLRAAFFRASTRFQREINVGSLDASGISRYGRENSAEAFAEAWTKIILEDPSEWDEATEELYSLIKEEAKASGVKLPPYMQKVKAGAPPGYKDVGAWKKVGEKKGSNAGGVFQDPDTGKRYYVKFYDDAEHVDNEVVANRLYREAGLETTAVHHGWMDGKYAVISEWDDTVGKATQAQLKANAMDGFATDAWLANWDSVGQTYDNMLINSRGQIVRVDAGGSLFYRAQGAPKDVMFGDSVGEMETLIEGKNPQAKVVFGDLTTEQKIASISRVESVSDEAIDELVDKYWRGGNDTMRDELKRKLKARRNDLLLRRKKLLADLEEQRKLEIARQRAIALGLEDPRPYKVRYAEWIKVDPKVPGSLTRGEADQIAHWTGSGYRAIREYQWKGHEEYKRIHGVAKARKVGRQVAEITNGLEKGPRYQGTIWRKMNINDPAKLKPWITKGARLEFDTHYSFAKSEGVWSGNVTVVIRNSKRSGVDVQKLSHYRNEQEVIALKGSQYLIDDVEDLGNSHYIVYLKEL